MAKFKVEVKESEWVKMIRDKQRPVATAAVAALRETARNARNEGRKDIAAAGLFGANWQRDLRYGMFDAEENGEPSLNARAVVWHKSALSGEFERAVTIQGKPLLWIPTTPRLPGGKPTPRPGKSGKHLTSATVRGLPMLFDADDRDRHRKPLYIGVRSVHREQKWHVTDIVKKHASQIARLFIKYFKGQ